MPSFADVVSDQSGLAPDNAQDRTPVPPAAEAPEPAVETPPVVDAPPVETPAVETPPVETPAPEPESDELNPHLAPKTPETPEPESDEIPEDQLKGMTKDAREKAKETWGNLKKARKEAESRLQERETELETLRKTVEESSKTGPEMEKLRKELADHQARLKEYEEELAIGRVEATREFKEKVGAPMSEAEATVKELSEKYEIPAATIMAALREPDAKRRGDALEDISVDFKNLDRIELVQASRAYAKAHATADALRAAASEKLAELDSVATRTAEENASRIAQEFRDSAKESFKALQDQIPLLQSVPNNKKWNDYLEGIEHEATSLDVNRIPVAEVARMAVSARALPEVFRYVGHYRNRAEKAEQEVASLKERLKDFRATEPGAGGGGREDAAPKGKGTSFIDSFDDVLARR